MMRLTVGLVLLVVILGFDIPKVVKMTSFAAEIKPKTIDGSVFARRVIQITDLVLLNEIDPPTRQEMILAGTRSLLKKSGQPVPIGMARKISALAQTGELEVLLKTLWKAAIERRTATAEELQAATLQGLLSSIPGQPEIMPPGAFKVVKQTKSNRYVGIGIQLTIEDGTATIRTPLPGGPAYQSGAKAGDRILEVDGKTTKGLTLAQVVALLRGDEGTKVTVLLQQPGESKPRKLKMTRGVVPFQSILGYRRLANGDWSFRISDADPIAYLAVPVIRVSSVQELRQIARLLRTDGIRAVVIDLRFSSGDADLRHAVFLADELLEKGKIGGVLNANGTKQEFEAAPDSLFKQWPIVVLVNQYTKAEAEFVAAALKDSGRAVIVGQQTAGTGYCRSAVELPDGLGGIMLRTSLMTRANGRTLQIPMEETTTSDLVARRPIDIPQSPTKSTAAWGVTPDEQNVVRINNEQLRKLLTWRSEQQVIGRRDKKQLPAPDDPQLRKAMEILKSRITQLNEKTN